jgi:hypothetical protein
VELAVLVPVEAVRKREAQVAAVAAGSSAARA